MAVGATAEAQTSIYETTIEDPALEAALEKRHAAREKLKPLKKAAKEADDQAKALADALDIGDDATVRVGRFLLTRRHVAGRDVSFTADATKRLYVKLVSEV